MFRRVCAGLSLMVSALGCAENKQASMSPMDMQPPPRPAELDRLDAFVGDWEGEAEVTVAGTDQKSTSHGRNRTRWAGDGRFLLEEWEHDMGEGQSMNGVAIFTWDPHDKKYRSWWFDSYGSNGTATWTYNESSRGWRMSSESRSPVNGEKMVGEGEARIVDENTMEWNFAQWSGGKSRKLMDMKGTSRRKPMSAATGR